MFHDRISAWNKIIAKFRWHYTRDDQKIRGLSLLLYKGLDERILFFSNDTWT